MTVPEFIYHLCPRSHWSTAQDNGFYTASSLDSEGFIHCSFDHQLEGSLNLHFRGQRDLMVLKIDPTQLTADLRYEPSRQGELFPHLYGPLNLEAVVTATPLQNQQA
jgi:uncharacterized protein (DUF952 family)